MSSLFLFTGESSSNVDGLTSDDDGISQEIGESNFEGNGNNFATGSGTSEPNDKGKLEFSALLATMKPQQLSKKGRFSTGFISKAMMKSTT